jgi:hypothetical protein
MFFMCRVFYFFYGLFNGAARIQSTEHQMVLAESENIGKEQSWPNEGTILVFTMGH